MVFFDLDGTLLDFKGAEYLGVIAFYEKYGNPLGLSQNDFCDLWCHIGQKYFSLFLKGNLSFEQQKVKRIKEIFSLVNISLTEPQASECFQFYLNNFEKNWKPFEDVIPCLESLKCEQLGILTNGDSKQQRQKLEKIGIHKYFELVITAGDIGVAKPEAKLFQTACNIDSGETTPKRQPITTQPRTLPYPTPSTCRKSPAGSWLQTDIQIIRCCTGDLHCSLTKREPSESLEPYDRGRCLYA